LSFFSQWAPPSQSPLVELKKSWCIVVVVFVVVVVGHGGLLLLSINQSPLVRVCHTVGENGVYTDIHQKDMAAKKRW
jgi:hypothetical protein